jgi:methionyl-tRNA synthetase
MPELILQNQWIVWLGILWSLPWKGMALWKAARRRDTWWFVALIVINTVGLLDIIYLYFISERRKKLPLEPRPLA